MKCLFSFLVASILVLACAGPADEPTPAPAVEETVQVPAVAPALGPTATPEVAAIPTPAPTPSPVPARAQQQETSGPAPMANANVSAPTSISVDEPTVDLREYAEWCGEVQSDWRLFYDREQTWAELAIHLQTVLMAYQEQEPAPESQTLHEAWEDAIQRMLDFVKEQDPQESYSLFDLVLSADVMASSIVISEIEEGLPEETLTELIGAGCVQGASGDDPVVQHFRQQDPMTDEVTLFFVAESTKDTGNLVIQAECGGDVQAFVDIYVFGWEGEQDTLLLRFDDEEVKEETWTWAEIRNPPETETLLDVGLTPGSSGTVAFLAKVMASEKLAVRRPAQSGIDEITLIFDTEELRKVWTREGSKGCEQGS